MSTGRFSRGNSALNRWALSLLAASAALLAGCSSSEVLVAHQVELVAAEEQAPLPEERLLDVAVAVFDPGVPEGEIDKEVLEELLREGTFVHIRRTEARYMAVELRDTLQRSRQWGRVWVTPATTTAADINVAAEILNSDGDQFALRVNAVDASGRAWISDKRYEMATAAGSFNRQRYPELDPYQDVFTQIANDLATAQAALSAREVDTLRQIAALRFAGELSPDAFAGYVEQNGRGEYQLLRLPATGDPMFARTQGIRQREFLFLDTLNQHYSRFHGSTVESYDGWRQYAREEAISVRELTRSARWRTGLGIATIVASMVYGSNSNNSSFSDRLVRDALMYVGMDVLRSASVHRQEKRLHSQTLQELSESFDDDVQPLVVQIEGTTHRLTGTAELQYEEWRQLLRQLLIEETGFMPTVDIYAEEPLPAQEAALAEAPATTETSADSAAPGEVETDETAAVGPTEPATESPTSGAEGEDAAVAEEPVESDSPQPASDAAAPLTTGAQNAGHGA
jgi:hypothetical protein